MEDTGRQSGGSGSAAWKSAEQAAAEQAGRLSSLASFQVAAVLHGAAARNACLCIPLENVSAQERNYYVSWANKTACV